MKKTNFRNYLILLATGIFLFFSFGCDGDKNLSNNAGIEELTHQDIQSDCLNQPESQDPVFGFEVDYQIENFSITASETDIAASPCFCECYFNLKSTLFDLPNGLYTVTLIGIGGDTVGIDTVTVGG
ncbi:MAG: hypothetical protein ACXADW_23195 [Candidatus Hodarchaeales archaeon]|jgi:hypothetical protein